MSDDQENIIREPDFPGSGNSFSSKTERMQDLVNFLVRNYQEISRVPMSLGKKIVIGGHDLKVYKDWLEKVHTYFREALNRDLTLTLAAEWVLDNYYIIRQALLQIRGRFIPWLLSAVAQINRRTIDRPTAHICNWSGCALLRKLFIEHDRHARHPNSDSGTCITDDGRIIGFTDFPAL